MNTYEAPTGFSHCPCHELTDRNSLMRMRARGWMAGLIFLSCSIAYGQVRDNKHAAREFYTEGTRLYDLNEYASALESFKKAYLAYEEPSLLFNIAQCQRQLGQKEEAVKTYRSFLRKLPTASNRNEVQKLIAKLEDAIDDARHANEKLPQEIAPRIAETSTVQTSAVVQLPVESKGSGPTSKPIYRKWWLWTAIGVVVVGAAVGIGLGVSLSSPSFERTLPETGPGSIKALTLTGGRF